MSQTQPQWHLHHFWEDKPLPEVTAFSYYSHFSSQPWEVRYGRRHNPHQLMTGHVQNRHPHLNFRALRRTPPHTTTAAVTTSAAPMTHVTYTRSRQQWKRHRYLLLQVWLAVSPLAHPQETTNERLGLRRNHHGHRTATPPSLPVPSQTVAQQGSERPELHPLQDDSNSHVRDKAWDGSQIIDGLCALHLCETARQNNCHKKRKAGSI